MTAWKRGLQLGSGLLLLLNTAMAAQAQTPPIAEPTGVVWPNADSKANSDDWIRLHHDQIRQMRPRLLVLNFVNGLSTEEATRKVNGLIAAVRESSRFHGYKRPNAPAFLDYQIAKVVDFTDPVPLPESQRLDGNSSLYPRPPDWKEGMINFQYAQLFGDKFAERYKISDPDNPTKMLNLEELVNRGLVHEVWFLALQGRYGAPFECTEVKQAYSATLHKTPGKWVQAGNGGTDEQPFIGRSLRILFINAERGPGCAMESLGHALEGTSNANAIPYFTRYFTEYAGFDLKKRYGIPFDKLYDRGGTELSYPTQDSLSFKWKGETITVPHYIPIGGSVHFTPTARRDYDLNNPSLILSTIEHYRLFDGPDGKDRPELWDNSRFARYRPLANDCQGPWVVYWRQNMPGFENRCKDDTGKPMKNWWPFLFY